MLKKRKYDIAGKRFGFANTLACLLNNKDNLSSFIIASYQAVVSSAWKITDLLNEFQGFIFKVF